MKYPLAILLLLTASGSAAAQQQIGQFQEDAVIWDGPMENIPANMPPVRFRGRQMGMLTEEQTRQQIQQTLQTQHDKGGAWAWRDAVENRLVSFGPTALPFIRTEMIDREGYELDALQVAAFRLENAPLKPRETITRWAEKQFDIPSPSPNPASSGTPPVKITRILNIGDLFPHHLFYVVEYAPKNIRLPLALAADAKIQPLEEDAMLARFIRTEADPQRSQVGRERLAMIAAALAAARTAAVYKPENPRTETQSQTTTAAFETEGFRQSAAATFDPAGTLQSLTTTQEKIAVKILPPITVPTTTTPPPPIPQ